MHLGLSHDSPLSVPSKGLIVLPSDFKYMASVPLFSLLPKTKITSEFGLFFPVNLNEASKFC